MDAGAATFRFNFGAADDAATAATPAAPPGDDDVAVEPGREVFPSLEVPQEGAGWRKEAVPIGTDGFTLLKADGTVVAAAAAALGGGVTVSDLVPGRYEGGLKLWECAVDLAAFMRCGGEVVGQQREPPPSLVGARVLELGCGHGLPGVLAALCGAASVTWQDYNEEVLHALTAPNAAANLAKVDATLARPALRFVAGDWGAPGMLTALPAGGADLVLSADTVYAPASQRRLAALIKRSLAPRGIALVAAKAYYFGVGGAAAAFAAGAAREAGLSARTVARFTDGASNVREILRLEHAAAPDA